VSHGAVPEFDAGYSRTLCWLLNYGTRISNGDVAERPDCSTIAWLIAGTQLTAEGSPLTAAGSPLTAHRSSAHGSPLIG